MAKPINDGQTNHYSRLCVCVCMRPSSVSPPPSIGSNHHQLEPPRGNSGQGTRPHIRARPAGARRRRPSRGPGAARAAAGPTMPSRAAASRATAAEAAAAHRRLRGMPLDGTCSRMVGSRGLAPPIPVHAGTPPSRAAARPSPGLHRHARRAVLVPGGPCSCRCAGPVGSGSGTAGQGRDPVRKGRDSETRPPPVLPLPPGAG